MVDIDTIGAGGGSIAKWMRAVFSSASGQQSAGDDPAPPLLLRRGGERADVHRSAARARRSARIAVCSAATLAPRSRKAGGPRRRWRRSAQSRDPGRQPAALGALQIQKFGLAQATAEQRRADYGPAKFRSFAARVAGPLFACDIALEARARDMLVPPAPGLTSATGMVLSK